MAEFVNQRLEDMLSELEQLKRMEIYSTDEIREISKKRTNFEYKMKRQTKSTEDFLSYIAYECLLLEDIALRRKKLNILEKKSDIEFAMIKRLTNMYRELVNRFPNHLELWLSYIVFCKNANLKQNVTAIIENMLQVHGNKPRTWLVACRWELDEMHSVATARSFILKGIQRHPTCSELYIEALRVELAVTEKQENELETQLERIKIIIKNARKDIRDVKLVIDVCSVLEKHEFVEELRTKLMGDLWDKFNDCVEAWEYVALCELQGKSTVGFQWQELDEEYRLVGCPDHLQNFCNVFETALSQITMAEMCESYIRNSIKLCATEEQDSGIRLQIAKRSLTKGHEMGRLTEEQYKLWLELMTFNHDDPDSIEQILEDACNNCPTSEFLWSERLQRCHDNPLKLIQTFKKAEESLPNKDIALLWIVLLKNTNALEDLQKHHNDSLRLQPDVVKKLRPIFLQQFYKCGGITTARKMYNSMVITPPITMELHKLMMDIEREQSIPLYNEWKRCHENATRQFGKTNPEVWLDFIQFEKEQGRLENCGYLYTRACATLDKKYVDKFIVDYTLNKQK